jgi:glycosyltransferase involved in cell wall biosynthesis
MRILYFHQHFNIPSGAGGLRSYKMARALVAAGHDVVMVCGSHAGCDTGLRGPFKRGKRRGYVDGIDVIEFDISYSNSVGLAGRSWRFLRFAWRSVLIALTQQSDLIFATSTPLTAGIPGIAASVLRQKKFVFEVRDLWPELPKAMGVIRNPIVLQALSHLEWLSYRAAHRHIALSVGIAEGMTRRGVHQSSITVIPNGADLDLFDPKATSRIPATLPKANLLAIYAGTHGTANGLENVLAAAAVLQGRGRHDILLLLVGQGREKSELMRQAGQLRLANIVFLDPVTKSEMTGLMMHCDIGLQVLKNIPEFGHGTSPNKFFDYLAAGLPVLTNYPGWVADLVVNSRCGYAVEPDNPDAFADALEAAANDGDSLKSKGRRARQLAESQFDRDRLANVFVAWLEGAVK